MTTRFLPSARSCFLSLTLVAGLSVAASVNAVSPVPDDLAAVVNASRHRIEPEGASHHADNQANRLHFQFGDEAVSIASFAPGQKWQFALKLTEYGTPGEMEPVTAATVAVTGETRLEYRRSTLTEWYENRPEGLEQGFTLTAPPKPGAKTVVLDLAISGGLQPKLAADGQSVALLDATGRPALIYGDLKVIDARGSTLPATLAMAGGAVRIAVQTEQAVWPIVIDPLVKSAVVGTGDLTGSDQFGYSVAVSGTTAVIGAPSDSHNGTATGAVYVYTRTAGVWTFQGEFYPSGPISSERFGYAVAVDGDTLAVGAPLPAGTNGRVCVFTGSGSTWTQQQCLTGANSNDQFGASVAVYGDTLVVGAPGSDSPASSSGAVHVFTRTGSTWTQRVIKLETSAGANHFFGSAVALSDGRFVAGAPGVVRQFLSGSPAESFSGTAEVFAGSGATWTSEGKLTPAGLLTGDRFGWSVALYQLNADPIAALVGAPTHDYTVGPVSNSGAAYVFVKGVSGWAEQARLEEKDHHASDQFGYAVALSDGTAVVSMIGSTVGAVTNAGETTVWTHGTGNTWTEQQVLDMNDVSRTPAGADSFGWSVAIAGDAVLASAPNEDTPATNHGNLSLYTFPCAFGRGFTAGQWMMISIPCQTASAANTVGTLFGEGNANYAHFTSAQFYPLTSWAIDTWTFLKRDATQASNTSVRLQLSDIQEPGTGYWLYSGTAPTGIALQANGAIGTVPLTTPNSTASTLVTAGTNGCPTGSNGCFAITLKGGNGRYNMIGNGLPFGVDWSTAVLRVETSPGVFTSYASPSAAMAANYMYNTAWVWGTGSYDSFTDLSPSPVIRVMHSFYVRMGSASAGATSLQLLLPAEPVRKAPAMALAAIDPTSQFDSISPAGLAKSLAPGHVELVTSERDRRVAANEKAIKAKKAWRVQLIVEIPDKGLRDAGNWLGQVPGAGMSYDGFDVQELAPGVTPYLTLVFPHPNWGPYAGNYAADFHSSDDNRNSNRTWAMEIRADKEQVGQTVFLRWEGDPAILRRCTVTDPATRMVYRPGEPDTRFGMPVLMSSQVQNLIWRCKEGG